MLIDEAVAACYVGLCNPDIHRRPCLLRCNDFSSMQAASLCYVILWLLREMNSDRSDNLTEMCCYHPGYFEFLAENGMEGAAGRAGGQGEAGNRK